MGLGSLCELWDGGSGIWLRIDNEIDMEMEKEN